MTPNVHKRQAFGTPEVNHPASGGLREPQPDHSETREIDEGTCEPTVTKYRPTPSGSS
jgi:hypothetical protein